MAKTFTRIETPAPAEPAASPVAPVKEIKADLSFDPKIKIGLLTRVETPQRFVNDEGVHTAPPARVLENTYQPEPPIEIAELDSRGAEYRANASVLLSGGAKAHAYEVLAFAIACEAGVKAMKAAWEDAITRHANDAEVGAVRPALSRVVDTPTRDHA